MASALMAKMQIAPEDRPKVKLECLRLLATLRLDPARMQLISGFVDTYLRLNAAEQRRFEQELAAIVPPEQETVMEITTSWQHEEALKLVKRQLARKCGPLTLTLEERVGELSTEQLEALGEALLFFETDADLTAWLDSNA